MHEINSWPDSDWKTVRLLGQGGYGKVYEIEREEMGHVYKAALKVIRIPKDESEIHELSSAGMKPEDISAYYSSMVETFVNENALLSQLKGFTNIVSYEDHKILHRKGDYRTTILIRMELLTPVKDFFRKNPPSEMTVLKLGTDITSALDICHGLNILHRDIKFDNIFVNRHGDFKLGDFGIARIVENASLSMTGAGTIHYMAPEVYHHKHYNHTIDLYSLGLVLYELLNNGRAPFYPLHRSIVLSDRKESIENRMSGIPIPEPLHGSPQLKKVLLKALAFRSEDRYQTAAQFRQALEDCMPLTQETPSALKEINPLPPIREKGAETTVPLSPKFPPDPVSAIQPPADPKPSPGQKQKPVGRHFIPIASAVLITALLSGFFFLKQTTNLMTEPAETDLTKAVSPIISAEPPMPTETPLPASETPLPTPTEMPSPTPSPSPAPSPSPTPVPIPEQAEEDTAQLPNRMICSFSQNAGFDLYTSFTLPAFGNAAYRRDQIRSVTFVHSLEDANETAWDLSEMQNKSILCWVIPNGDLYDLFIGSDRPIEGSPNCKLLFSGLSNAKTITFNEWFKTDSVFSMRGMFNFCQSLESIDLSDFNVHQVTTIGWMFDHCESLKEVEFGEFDTASLTEMCGMFSECISLEEVDLSAIETGLVTNMQNLFENDKNLRSLDLSTFDTHSLTKVYKMFAGCSSLVSLNTDGWDTRNVTEARKVFNGCRSLPDSMKISFPNAKSSPAPQS